MGDDRVSLLLISDGIYLEHSIHVKYTTVNKCIPPPKICVNCLVFKLLLCDVVTAMFSIGSMGVVKNSIGLVKTSFDRFWVLIITCIIYILYIHIFTLYKYATTQHKRCNENMCK